DPYQNDSRTPRSGLVVDVERRSKLVVRPREPAGVRVLQLRDARPHDRREVEEVDAAIDCPGRERVAAVVEATVVEPRGPERGRPFAMAELLGFYVAASSSGERGAARRSAVASRRGRPERPS